jgi:hypothetical protein
LEIVGEFFGPMNKPHEREWLKHVVKLGEGKTVKVVGNDEGGAKRCGNPRRGN